MNAELLEFYRGFVPERRMSPLTVLEDLEILEDLAAPLLARLEHVVSEQFSFQGRKERLHHPIVKTIPFLAHAGHGTTFAQRRWIQATRVWRPTIRMMNHAGWGASPREGHLLGRQRQIRRQPFSPCPAHDKARIKL